MKKIIFFFIIISAFSLSGQTNSHLMNSRWINGYYELESWGPSFKLFLKKTTKYCTTTRDTLIDGMNYIQLFDCGQQPNVYRGALRMDSTRWYFYSRDSTNEMLLYDFGLAVGDTLHEKFYYDTATVGGWDDMVLTQIDTVSYMGTTLRYFYFDQSSAAWIEGVGNSQGLLWDPYPNVSSYGLSLECYSKNDTTLYYSGDYNPNQINEACQLSFSLEDNILEKTEIYPNPAAKSFTLNIPHFSGSLLLSIYSLDGKEMHRQNINQAHLTVNPNLKGGSYLIKIEDLKGRLKFTDKLVWE